MLCDPSSELHFPTSSTHVYLGMRHLARHSSSAGCDYSFSTLKDSLSCRIRPVTIPKNPEISPCRSRPLTFPFKPHHNNQSHPSKSKSYIQNPSSIPSLTSRNAFLSRQPPVRRKLSTTTFAPSQLQRPPPAKLPTLHRRTRQRRL
jgi:hypothetical protein